MTRHDDDPRRIPDAEVIDFIQRKSLESDLIAFELLATIDDWLDACPHHAVCDSEGDCNRRGLECRCVEPHETEPECRAWLREHSDGTE